jgi:hypothetical protein
LANTAGAGQDRLVTDARSPVDAALDLFVYMPVGLALTAAEEIPKLAAKGRAQVGSRLAIAKVVGQFTVAQGRKELTKRFAPGATPGGPGGARQEAGRPTGENADFAPPPGSSGPGVEAAGPDEGSAGVAASKGHDNDDDPPSGGGSSAAGAGISIPTGEDLAGEDVAGDPAGSGDDVVRDAAVSGQDVAGDAPGSGQEVVRDVAGSGDDDGAVASTEAPPSPAGLAIPGYDSLAASQVVQRLDGLSTEELAAVAAYERTHRARRTILTRVRQLQEP